MDQLLAQEDVTASLSSPDRVLWPLTDHLQTTRDLIDNAGDLRAHYEYDSFGQLLSGDTPLTRYLFTAREHDPATSLNYHRARHYDPTPGRWISEDPLEFEAGDRNLSRYVGNSAIEAVDPSGLEKDIEALERELAKLHQELLAYDKKHDADKIKEIQIEIREKNKILAKERNRKAANALVKARNRDLVADPGRDFEEIVDARARNPEAIHSVKGTEQKDAMQIKQQADDVLAERATRAPSSTTKAPTSGKIIGNLSGALGALGIIHALAESASEAEESGTSYWKQVWLNLYDPSAAFFQYGPIIIFNPKAIDYQYEKLLGKKGPPMA